MIGALKMARVPTFGQLKIDITLEDGLNGFSYATSLASLHMTVGGGWHTSVLDTCLTLLFICFCSRPKEMEFGYALPIKHLHGLSLCFGLTLQSLHLTLALEVYNSFIPKLISTLDNKTGLGLWGIWF